MTSPCTSASTLGLTTYIDNDGIPLDLTDLSLCTLLWTAASASPNPIVFTGQQLHVNYSTSAAGSLYVELQDLDGQPLSGFTQQDSLEHYGDSTEQVIRWKSGTNVSTLTGKPIRIRFILKDGDLYSYQFGTTDVR